VLLTESFQPVSEYQFVEPVEVRFEQADGTEFLDKSDAQHFL
jgi:hypothetical protein